MKVKHEIDIYAGVTGFDEQKDCSVRAFSIAACISYEESHKAFERHGRISKKPTTLLTSRRVWKELFPDYEWIEGILGMTLNQFALKHNKGHYVVHTRGHALAVCDGVIHDWSPSIKRKVHQAVKLV